MKTCLPILALLLITVNTFCQQRDWFDYVGIGYQSGVSVKKEWIIYEDSTPIYAAGMNKTGPIDLYGIGVSFDPCALWFQHDPQNPTTPAFNVPSACPYSVDSISFELLYVRKPYNNYNDSLLVDVVYTADPNHTFRLQYAPGLLGYNVNQVDSIMRFADATYDNVQNKLSDSISPTSKVVIRYELQNKDTVPGNVIAFKLPILLGVPAGHKTIAFIHFKSGHNYPAGITIDSVNHLRLYSYALGGANSYPYQYGVDYNTILFANKYARYGLNGSYLNFMGHKLLVPPFSETAVETGTGMSDIRFYVEKYPWCPNGVDRLTTDRVTVAPNPARSYIDFKCSTHMHANISITDGVGSVIYTGEAKAGTTLRLPVYNLPAGIYFYSVTGAGHSYHGRFVVSH